MATTKEAAAKKPAAKKPTAKKATPKKPAAKKPAAKKAAPKKLNVEKPAVKKRAAKKPAAKKPLAKDSCFTIMPFGDLFDDYYEFVYIPAIKASNLLPKRADDLYRPSTIIHDIWAMTHQAKIILADLSGKNPNVFYELGLAHALAKPAILIAESFEDVPFDLRALRVIIYDKNKPNWGQLLKEDIESAIKEVLESPLDAVLPAFLNIKKSSETKTVSKEKKELISLKQDIDLLKRQIRRGTFTPISPGNIKTMENALTFIKPYLISGYSDEEIITLLSHRGVKGSSALHAISEARKEINTATSDS